MTSRASSFGRPSTRPRATAVRAALAVIAASGAAHAETTVRATVDAPVVEVGQDVHVTLRADSDEGEPRSAELGPHAGFTARGPSVGRSQSVTIVNGRRSDKIGLTATWSLRAERTGTFVVGPSSVATDTGRKHAATLSVRVVPRGQAPARPAPLPDPNDPFAPFGGFPFGRPTGPGTDPFRGFFDDAPDDDLPDSAPAELRLPHARAQGAFLHARVDRPRAVIGEQVTYSVFLYTDRSAPEAELSDVHEADAPDFLKRSLLTDESTLVPVGHVRIDGRTWDVKLVRKSALFPLKTGALAVRPMRLSVSRRRGAQGQRESETLTVDVQEPPLDGRPPTYVVGDVGTFQLRADVAPRDVEQGGSIGVDLELGGTGNLPEKLPVPTRPGVVWLEPELRSSVGPDGRGRYGGTRRFRYVVRLERAGTIDLGEVALAYYDPQKRAYATTRAALGTVKVTPREGGAPGGAAAPDDAALANLPSARPALAGAPAPKRALLDRAPFRAALFALPAFAAAIVAGAEVRRRLRARAPREKVRRASDALDAARALVTADAVGALREVGRALEAGVRERTDVALRGLSADERVPALAARGVPGEVARDVDDVLAAVEAARFSPAPPTAAAVAELIARADRALAALASRRRP